jgi:hypothetical protein
MYICVGVSILPLLDPTQVVSTKATHEKVYKIQHVLFYRSKKKKRVNWDRINKLAEPFNRDHEVYISLVCKILLM